MAISLVNSHEIVMGPSPMVSINRGKALFSFIFNSLEKKRNKIREETIYVNKTPIKVKIIIFLRPPDFNYFSVYLFRENRIYYEGHPFVMGLPKVIF